MVAKKFPQDRNTMPESDFAQIIPIFSSLMGILSIRRRGSELKNRRQGCYFLDDGRLLLGTAGNDR